MQNDPSVPVIWPMGAQLTSPDKLALLWDDENYVAETKIPGERIICHITDTGVRLFTRSGNDFHPDRPIEVTHRWPQIQAISKFLPVGTIIDGEVWSPKLREEQIAGLFNYKSDAPMPDDMKYVLFDCLAWADHCTEDYTWIERRAYVNHAIRLVNLTILTETVFTHNHKREFFEEVIRQGGEGVVLKHIYSPYVQGKKPAGLWVKAKKKDTYDCIITGFKPGAGKYSKLIGSVELSQYVEVAPDKFELKAICHSSGIPDALRRDMTANPDKYLGQVVVVDAYERVRDSLSLKQPRIKSIRPEGSKNPKDCKVE